MTNSILDDLNWRYATKKFDSEKRISNEDLETIKDILRLTPTSYGLQGLKFVLVENKNLRSEIQKAAWNQEQVTEASHLIVLCYVKNLGDSEVDSYVNLMSSTRDISIDKLEGFSGMMKNTIASMSEDQKGYWLSKQVYIALGQLMVGLSTMKIDSTPMEGFDPKKVDEILKLNDLDLSSVLICPIGYRHEEDMAQHQKKVRQSKDDMFIEM